VDVAWDDARGLWFGHAILDSDGRIEVAIDPGDTEPELTRSYAVFALSQLTPRVGAARKYAAGRLIEDYNALRAHLLDEERVTAEEFAKRLRLERFRFRDEGVACLDFSHDLYRGDYLYEGGLVVVETAADGRFRRAYWVTEPDAREAHRTNRCT
jgi:hypothetical protein